MRIRSIKPEFWRSADVAAQSLPDRLLFIGLWSYVDDNGVGDARPSSIAADLFAEDLSRNPRATLARVSNGLKQLFSAGLIELYEGHGKELLHVTTWEENQKIDRPSLGHKYPLPPAESPDQPTPHPHNSRDTRETLAPGTGEQGNRGSKNTLAPAALAGAFDDAYEHWPKKVERKQALDRFKAASKKIPLDELTAKVIQFGDAYAATTDRRFVPALGVWLGHERWTDELPAAPPPEQGRTQQQLDYGLEWMRSTS